MVRPYRLAKRIKAINAEMDRTIPIREIQFDGLSLGYFCSKKVSRGEGGDRGGKIIFPSQQRYQTDMG
jgi:hypothetical protein